MKITKAIIPVAGRGTRVMPLTFHQPKGMIAIADRPMIHYVIDELIQAGVKEITMVLSSGQEVFKNYLDYLQKDNFWRGVKFYFVKQQGPHGNGDAVYITKNFINKDEPFIVCFPDDLFDVKHQPLRKMISFFEKVQTLVLLLEEVPKKLVSAYGVIESGEENLGNFVSIIDLVEKPPIKEAPSRLAVVGRYVLSYEIFDHIEKLYPYGGKELYLADAIKDYIYTNQKIWGLEYDGLRFDCGSKKGLMKAQIHFSMNHPEIKKEIHKIIKN